jgi:hypothetical protein
MYIDILQFHEILIRMVLFPLPCATYPSYWTYASPIFTWTNMMTIRRFKQLRTVLHFNLNIMEVKGRDDALHKTRLLLNILKNAIGFFLIPGLKLSLNGASCASRSSYGRELICSPPANNCGNLCFRFYLLCDALIFACLMIKVATKNDSNPTDLEEIFESIQQEENHFKLVLERCP